MATQDPTYLGYYCIPRRSQAGEQGPLHSAQGHLKDILINPWDEAPRYLLEEPQNPLLLHLSNANLNNYLLNDNSVTDTPLGAGNIAERRTNTISAPRDCAFHLSEQINKERSIFPI